MLIDNHISQTPSTVGTKGNLPSVTRPNSQHRDAQQVLQPTQEYFKDMFRPERTRKLPKLYYTCKNLYNLDWLVFFLPLSAGPLPSVLSSVQITELFLGQKGLTNDLQGILFSL